MRKILLVTPPSRISDVFAARRQQGQLAFMPFVTAGDPDLATTARLIERLAASGADLIEIGFPYSDPIADGPVIQASYTRALASRLRIPDLLAMVSEVSRKVQVPLVAMVSYAIIFRTGTEAFVRQASEAGFAGLIVPDLPGDEAQDFFELAQRHGLDLIQLVAPTTPADRSERILRNASGFVYCIAVAGTTGTRESLAPQLAEMLQMLRRQTTLPLAVGFGLSRPDQVQALHGLADGAIVGSAIVRHLEGISSSPEALNPVAEYVKSMADAAHSVSVRT